MKARHIKLSDAQKQTLIKLKRKTISTRVGDRCHALILSSKGYTITQLCDIFEVNRETISTWFDRWETSGVAGLKDRPKPGRPPIFTPSEKKKL